MNAGAISERVYAGLKRRILNRQFRPGDRLDPAALADELLSSVTPVRDALHRLTGERLIEARTSEGFYLPQVDAPGLHDLYAWNGEVLILAIKSWRSTPPVEALPENPTAADVDVQVEWAATLFARVAARSTNLEHRAAIASGNDRLHAIRRAEAQVLTGIVDELRVLQAAIDGAAAPQLRSSVAAYHRRRRRFADEVVWTLYRNGVPR